MLLSRRLQANLAVDNLFPIRARLTQDLIEDLVGIAGEVHAQGSSVLARIFSLIVVGDLVSVAVAERAGADPMPVEVIEELKARLALEDT